MDGAAQRVALNKTARLVPFLFLLYVVAYLDRVNVGFAKLQMQSALHFTDVVYGTGAGIFFLGYFLFEVPSNLILQRVGARRWIARIMATWGLTAMAMMFVRSAGSFYALRFLLGLTEAGFFPGIILYMTYWFTAAERARIVAWFMTANAAAFIVGGPFSGYLLTLHRFHLAGWQWLFLLEGIPALALGAIVFRYLPDGPDQARWLSPQERTWLQERLQHEERHKQTHGVTTLRAAAVNPAVWLLCVLYFALVLGMYGLSLWLPELIKEFSGLSNLQVGMISALPYLAAAVAMVVSATHSDRTGERRLHISGAAFVGALGLFLSAMLHSPVARLSALALAAAGMWSTLGPFWSLPTAFLGGTAAAGGIALINAVGNLGGFVGPYLMGELKERFKSTTPGLLTLAGSPALGGLLVLMVRYRAPSLSEEDRSPDPSIH